MYSILTADEADKLGKAIAGEIGQQMQELETKRKHLMDLVQAIKTGQVYVCRDQHSISLTNTPVLATPIESAVVLVPVQGGGDRVVILTVGQTSIYKAGKETLGFDWGDPSLTTALYALADGRVAAQFGDTTWLVMFHRAGE